MIIFRRLARCPRVACPTVWGCGAGYYSQRDLADFPIDPSELATSCESVSQRLGVVGSNTDDMADYYGYDPHLGPGPELNEASAKLLRGYVKRKRAIRRLGFYLGRSRLAVVSAPRDGRLECDRLGLCLWGCPRGSLYNANYDLRALVVRDRATYCPGLIVDKLVPVAGGWSVQGTMRDGGPVRYTAKRVVLAAGTLATTAILMRSRGIPPSVRLASCPMAAFLLWQPSQIGAVVQRAFALAQLAYRVEIDNETLGYGGIFPTFGLPVADFIRHTPFARRFSADILKGLLSSTSVANLFFPSRLSNHRMTLKGDGRVTITGGKAEDWSVAVRTVRQRLTSAFRNMGGWVLPATFTIGDDGADAHYASTVPMRANPGPGDSNAMGQVFGMAGVYVADGAALTSLPARPHTPTIMANAHRIGGVIALEITTTVLRGAAANAR